VIDPTDPPEVQIAKQARIIEALVARAERGGELGGSAYALFQSAIALQARVWEKTRDLEAALDTLGRASSELERVRGAQERMQRSLADAMGAMEGGFALFSEERLQACNDAFRRLLPDVEPVIEPGLALDDYLARVASSRFVQHRQTKAGSDAAKMPGRPADRRFSSHVMALRNDRWFQISYRQTRSGNVAVLQTEITEIVRGNRREKDRLIDQQADFLQAAFDHMSLGICTFAPDGALLVRNGRFGDLLGVPLSLLKKGTFFQRIADYVLRFEVARPELGGPGLSGWAKALRRGQAVQERLRRPDGVSLEVRIHALPDDGFLVTVMDVTAEADAAEARQRINALLERRVAQRTAELTKANRLLQVQSDEQARTEEALRLAKEAAETAHQSKTRFLAAASHDLLQPINAAKLYISTLAETALVPAAAETVGRLDRTFQSIETLLHALLDIARLDSPGAEFNVTDFALDDVLGPLVADSRPLAAERGLALVVLPTAEWVRSDLRYLMRSLQNLLVNAIQYTASGRVLIGCRRQGDTLRIEVHDTGPGIAEADQRRIFGEFTRGSAALPGSGMGLGLSIVERACRHLGHPVGLRSWPGRGSVFSITVPRVAAPAGAGRGADDGIKPAGAVVQGALDRIVLVIENDPAVLHATTRRLEGWGASVLAADSTAAALRLMRDIGSPPDIILADYHLDEGDDGVRAIAALRAAAGAPVPAIVLTADRSRKLLRLGTEAGFTVLTKPVPLARLRALIDWKTRAEAVRDTACP